MNPLSTLYDARKRVLYCPACQVELKTTERQGVDIDYCPLCQAIWLQRGELNVIVERSATTAKTPLDAVHQDASEAASHSLSRGFQNRHSRDKWFDFG
jgi:Zn-finger nucleic acid-binding protein